MQENPAMANITTLTQLGEQIIQCRQCPRLVEHREAIAEKKVRRYRDHTYWGKPVPGFGDPDPRVLIIGLAPAAHGANRTGRMFTGDSSGDWLYQALYEAGFSNQPESYALDDGLALSDVFITAVARCAPPQNNLTAREIANCSPFLEKELALFTNLRVILCLGGVAFKRYCQFNGLKGLEFGHHKLYELDNGLTLMASYHPSRQNTNTGRLKWDDWLGVFREVRGKINKS